MVRIEEMTMIQFFHSNNPADLASLKPSLTVEAEYGEVVVEGLLYTAAHHQQSGPYVGDHLAPGGRPSPCNDPQVPILGSGDWIVGISHFDLDTVGGCLRALPEAQDLFTPDRAGFWALAAFVDTRGLHRLAEASASSQDVLRLAAWRAFARLVPPLPAWGPTNCTALIMRCAQVLREILADDEERISRAREQIAADDLANQLSFVELRASGLIVRRSPSAEVFVNHLYNAPNGEAGTAIATLNRDSGAITISLALPVEGVSCVAIVRGLWGGLAGGHPGIAGSPRGLKMQEEDFARAIAALEGAMAGASRGI